MKWVSNLRSCLIKLKTKHLRYLVGPVSISGSYSSLSKALIIKYIEKNHFDQRMGVLVKAKKKFRFKHNEYDVNIDDFDPSDLPKLDKMIEEIEPNHFRIPILLKKYLKQNAKFLGFNLDPSFNNCLDGFIVLDLCDMDTSMINNLSKDVDSELISRRFS